MSPLLRIAAFAWVLFCVATAQAGGIGGASGDGQPGTAAPPTPAPPATAPSTPAPAGPLFDVLFGQDLPGGDYRSPLTEPGLENISLDQCEAACRDDARCQAYTFNSNSAWCFLKSSVAPAAPFGGAISGVRRAAATPAPTPIPGLPQGGAAGGVVNLELDGDRPGPLEGALAGVTARLFYGDAVDEYGTAMRAPTLEVFVNGARVARIEAEGNGWDWPTAHVQIAEMDPGNATPEVYFATFTGGAHCCTRVEIASADTRGVAWSVVEVGEFDGDPYGTRDLDGDGVNEWVTRDNGFLYTFTSYAGSFAPDTIHQLRGGGMIDMTFDPRFHAVHRQWLAGNADMEAQVVRGSDDPNGFLAAYVAVRALLGEGDAAWAFMLQHYKRNADWDYTFCEGGYDADWNCLREVRYGDFPQALRAFLVRAGYWRGP